MPNDIQQFNINDAIRDRVRQAFFDAIPQDVLDGYIKREVDAFFTTKSEYGREASSEFRQLVWASIRAEISPIIGEWVKTSCKEYLEQFGDEKFREELAKRVLQAQSDFWMGMSNLYLFDLPGMVDRKIAEMRRQGQL